MAFVYYILFLHNSLVHRTPYMPAQYVSMFRQELYLQNTALQRIRRLPGRRRWTKLSTFNLSWWAI